MVDTGSAVNLIKLKSVNPEATIDQSIMIPLIGISATEVMTIGITWVSIGGQPTLFHVVPSSFPIRRDGILGRVYLKDKEAVISYYKNRLMISGDVMNPLPFLNTEDYQNIDHTRDKNSPQTPPPTIHQVQTPKNKAVPETTVNTPQAEIEPLETKTPPMVQTKTTEPTGQKQRWNLKKRCRQVKSINLVDTNIGVGYLPRIQCKPGVFLGNALVTNNQGVCQVLAINTNEEDVTIEINPCKLIPCDYDAPSFDPDTSTEEECDTITDPEKRVQEINKILKTNQLNQEERDQVHQIVREYHDVFRLPGDKLSCTDQVEHEIPTENNIPVHTKQYRHPPLHREIMKEDIAKKLQDDIIEPSTSPY